MFNKVIEIKKPNDIRFGTTQAPFERTYGQIMKLLDKFGCQQIITTRNGNEHQIGFLFEGKPYMVQIPQVFVKNIYNERIGVRLVFYYLETVLNLSKTRAIIIERVLLSSRIIDTPDGGKTTVGDVAEGIPDTELISSITEPTKQLKVDKRDEDA